MNENSCFRRLLRSRGIKMINISYFLQITPATTRGLINNPMTMKLYERDALAAWLQIPPPDLDEIFKNNKEAFLKHL